jgi:hypothetical protein
MVLIEVDPDGVVSRTEVGSALDVPNDGKTAASGRPRQSDR